ncbi:DUF1800 domain-containing protein [Nocardioides deserti]|uniref:DUF1800 domain-containing protein n=1 Tax=Nocardioides deserti TaxID=1588644 RepID=A0ABR6UDF8_9ACTN|nr:DUF1800 domain-containing protein [Nocardioides deserti]MBC2962183.1 DUF1800 domain-containing protein [Nocardioides deserti]GGO67900.1 hypothetical protein GCM10012276_00430 [Nocardioides deserti]
MTHAATRARTAYKPARFPGAPLLGTQARHLVGRFSYGVTPALAAQVRAAGGAHRWFERQLEPSRVADRRAAGLRAWWPSFDRRPAELWQRQERELEGGWEVMEDYARWALVRRITSDRQVLEVMTELWENHFNVPAVGDAQFTYRVSYGDTIRSHALGRFDDLLHAAVTHPAMGIFLDNAVSTARHPNENLGRELLELHTVGRGQYSEDDVKASARILTGFRVDLWDSWEASYSPRDHWTGPVKVMGFRDPNAERDGRPAVRRYLSYLAHHPATAQRVARRLAVKFVRDDPPQALVDRLAKVYLDADTEIRPVLRALVASPQFKASVGSKVRDPGEDLVATYRVLRVQLARPPAGRAGDEHAVKAMLWQVGNLGTSPFSWPRPDGQPIDSESWSSPSRVLASMDLHWAMAGGWWPSKGITYRTPKQWLPRKKIRFDLFVDHLSQQLLHRRSTATLLRACCEMCDVSPGDVISADHPIVKWDFHRLLGTVLDSPAHFTR